MMHSTVLHWRTECSQSNKTKWQLRHLLSCLMLRVEAILFLANHEEEQGVLRNQARVAPLHSCIASLLLGMTKLAELRLL